MKKANYLKTIFLLWGLIAGIGNVNADDYVYEWVKVTDLSKVNTGDLVVLASGDLALINDNLMGAFATPITISDGIILDEDVAENIQWTLTKQEDGDTYYYKFAKPAGIQYISVEYDESGNSSVVVGSTVTEPVTDFMFEDYGDDGGKLYFYDHRYIKLAGNMAVVGSPGSNFTLYKRTVKNFVKWKKVSDDVIPMDGEVVVVVDLNTETAMSNDKADKDPDAVAVTLNDDKDRILGDVAEKVQWTFKVPSNGPNFQFMTTDGKNYLYADNGLKVGNESDKDRNFTKSFIDNVCYLKITTGEKDYLAGVEESMFSNSWKLKELKDGKPDDAVKDTRFVLFQKVEDPIKKVTIQLAEYYNYDLKNKDQYTLYERDFNEKVTITGAEKSEINWTSSNPDVAEINAQGAITLKKRGTTVITATVALSEYHDKASTKCTLIVDDSSTADLGTLALPLTVAEAKQLAETGKVEHDGTVYLTLEEGVNYYIKGKVSKVNSGMMAMFGDMDFGEMMGGSGSEDSMDDMDFDPEDMEESGFDMSSFDMSSFGFDMSAMFGTSDKVTYYISDDGTKDGQMKVINGCGTLSDESTGGTMVFNTIPKLSPGDCVVVCGPLVYTEDTSMFSGMMGGGSGDTKMSGKVDEMNYLAVYDPTLLIKDDKDGVVDNNIEIYVNKTLDGQSVYEIDNIFDYFDDEVKIPTTAKIEKATFKSSDEDIAKCEESEDKTTTIITGVNEGKAKITVKVKVVLQEADDQADPKVEEKSYTMKRKFKLIVKTRDVEPAGKYAGDYVLTTSTDYLTEGARLILVGTRVKEDKESTEKTYTDYVMVENNAMMGGGKNGSKYEFEEGDNTKELIPCEKAPKGTLEVVLEPAGDDGSWYLNVGKDENGDNLYLYASDTSEDKEEEQGDEQGDNKFDINKIMEMISPSSGLKTGTMAAATADSCKATISITENIATISFPKTQGKNNTIMLSSSFDMEEMMGMFGGMGGNNNEEQDPDDPNQEDPNEEESTFDMGSFDMFMAAFNTKKEGEADDKKAFMPRIYRFVPDESFGIKVGESGWSSIVTYNDVTIPENLEAYVVTKVREAGTDKTAILAPAEGLKGGHPYLLHTENPGSFTLTLSNAVDAPVKNLLQVSDSKTGDGVFVLAKPEGQEAAFYVWDGGLLGSGRVYLPAESGTSLARILIDFYDEPVGIATGITDVKQSSDMKAYDLQGRRVVAPKGQVQKGLYIVNGRKVVIK